jgi:arsenate reductase (glutaredoxin)
MSIVLYGIPNCDKVKLARAWFAEREMAYEFHDYKKQGVPVEEIKRWMKAHSWEALLNRQGTTWRKLDAAAQAQIKDAESALALMQAQPSVIKRPVVVCGAVVIVGFEPQAFSSLA